MPGQLYELPSAPLPRGPRPMEMPRGGAPECGRLFSPLLVRPDPVVFSAWHLNHSATKSVFLSPAAAKLVQKQTSFQRDRSFIGTSWFCAQLRCLVHCTFDIRRPMQMHESTENRSSAFQCLGSHSSGLHAYFVSLRSCFFPLAIKYAYSRRYLIF